MENAGVNAINTISHGTEIKGTINASGDFRLDGTLEGDIVLDGKLVVGENGSVRGNIVCQNANIIGTVWGNVTVKDLLSLHSTGVVKGDIVINKLSIEPGAQFVGTCKMYQDANDFAYNYATDEERPDEQ